jgi:hypothetical protein
LPQNIHVERCAVELLIEILDCAMSMRVTTGCPSVLAPSKAACRRARRYRQAFLSGVQCVMHGAPGLSPHVLGSQCLDGVIPNTAPEITAESLAVELAPGPYVQYGALHHGEEAEIASAKADGSYSADSVEAIGAADGPYAADDSDDADDGSHAAEVSDNAALGWSGPGNALDVVYELVAELSNRAPTWPYGGWICTSVVADNAQKIGMSTDVVFECLDIWVALDVLTFDEDGSQVKFIVQNMHEKDAASVGTSQVAQKSGGSTSKAAPCSSQKGRRRQVYCSLVRSGWAPRRRRLRSHRVLHDNEVGGSGWHCSKVSLGEASGGAQGISNKVNESDGGVVVSVSRSFPGYDIDPEPCSRDNSECEGASVHDCLFSIGSYLDDIAQSLSDSDFEHMPAAAVSQRSLPILDVDLSAAAVSQRSLPILDVDLSGAPRMLDDLGGSEDNIDCEPNFESSPGPSAPCLLFPDPDLSSSFPRPPPPGLDKGKHINHDLRDPPPDMLEPSGLVIQQSGDPNNWRHPHEYYDKAKSRSSNNSNSNTAITFNVEPALLDLYKLVKFDKNIVSSKYVRLSTWILFDPRWPMRPAMPSCVGEAVLLRVPCSQVGDCPPGRDICAT